jgi:hypothetical protein
MIVVVVPVADQHPDQLNYSGGIYKYKSLNIKDAFRQFTIDFIDNLNTLYKAAGRKTIRELPDNSACWRPILSSSIIYDYSGYLKISTPSNLITYTVYAFSDTADGKFYSWKEYGFDKIFNSHIREQKAKRYVCKVFYTSYAKKPQLDTFVLYKKSIEDLRSYLGEKYNPVNRLRHVSTSDNSNTSFSELFYAEDNCLELAILVERTDR